MSYIEQLDQILSPSLLAEAGPTRENRANYKAIHDIFAYDMEPISSGMAKLTFGDEAKKRNDILVKEGWPTYAPPVDSISTHGGPKATDAIIHDINNKLGITFPISRFEDEFEKALVKLLNDSEEDTTYNDVMVKYAKSVSQANSNIIFYLYQRSFGRPVVAAQRVFAVCCPNPLLNVLGLKPPLSDAQVEQLVAKGVVAPDEQKEEIVNALESAAMDIRKHLGDVQQKQTDHKFNKSLGISASNAGYTVDQVLDMAKKVADTYDDAAYRIFTPAAV